MAIEPTGRVSYLIDSEGINGNIRVLNIDSKTGTLTSSGEFIPTGANPKSITIDASGKFVYVANNASNNISTYAIDPITGGLTPMTPNALAGAGPIAITTTGVIQ